MSAQGLDPHSTPIKQRAHRPVDPARQKQILHDISRAWSQPLRSLNSSLSLNKDDSETEEEVNLLQDILDDEESLVRH